MPFYRFRCPPGDAARSFSQTLAAQGVQNGTCADFRNPCGTRASDDGQFTYYPIIRRQKVVTPFEERPLLVPMINHEPPRTARTNSLFDLRPPLFTSPLKKRTFQANDGKVASVVADQ